MMQRTMTRRMVEDDGDERGDNYDGTMRFDASGGMGSLQVGYSMSSARDPSLDRNSLRMTMTPTTRFLDQPILIDMSQKDAKSTGSSQTLPGGAGGGERSGASGSNHAHRVNEELVNLTYETPSMLWMGIAAVVGAGAGLLFDHLGVDKITQAWIGEIGTLYVNLMECLALPLIFTTVALCMAHLVVATKTYGVLFRMLAMFFSAAFLASGVGLLVSYAMSSTFSRQTAPPVQPPSTVLALQCPNEKYLAYGAGMCVGKQMRDAMMFVATNITGIELKNTGDDVVKQNVSYATQIIDFFSVLFQQNITEAFATGQYLGVIVFSMFIGAGLVISQEYPDMAGQTNYMYVVLKQLDVVLEMILNWLIRWIPLGTVSALAYSVMTGTITADTFQQAKYLPITLLVALLANFLCVICVAYYVLVRKNPFKFFWYLMPALVFMFASESYVATIPVMMRSVESSKQVSRTLTQFVVSIGTALSLCGHAAFFSVACVFMAYTSGLESQLTAGRIILLIIVSALSSFGTPQAPGASLTYVATIWRTVFGSAPPGSFAFVVWMEWLTVRMRRVHNITVVAFIARVIAEQLDESAEDEEDRAHSTTATARQQGLISPL